MPGVVARGRERRKETYLAQRVEVQRFEIVKIWSASRVSRERESEGRMGVSAGQFGGGACWTGALEPGGCLEDGLAVFDFGAIVMADLMASVTTISSLWKFRCVLNILVLCDVMFCGR